MRDIQVFLGFANNQIAASLLSIMKTSSIKSTKPRKGVVGVGGSGRNRVKLVGKHEVDKVNDGGDHSGNFDRKFHLLYDGCTIHLDAQDKLINRFIN